MKISTALADLPEVRQKTHDELKRDYENIQRESAEIVKMLDQQRSIQPISTREVVSLIFKRLWHGW